MPDSPDWSHSPAASPPLILFSGLAANANVFRLQKQAFPQLIVPDWPAPQPKETLDSYCERLADSLRSHENAIIGGTSFGGIIALHVARRLRPRAVVLIGSVASPDELSRVAKVCRPLEPLVPWMPVRVLQWCCKPIASQRARRHFPFASGLARQFCGADPSVFKWSLARVLDWRTAPAVDCPVFHVHGERDYILPLRYTHADTIVAGGGHVISLTHADEVNAFLRTVIGQTVGR